MDEKKTAGQAIKDLVPGKFLNLGKVLPSGSLEARKLSSGAVVFYWRSTINGKTEREAIGHYDPKAPPKSLEPTTGGYSIAAANHAAEALAKTHHKHKAEGGLPALKAAEKATKKRATEARQAQEKQTLQNLLVDYCNYLEGLGRSAHADARSIFKNHVVDAWPDIATLPANEVSTEQVTDIMRRLSEQGKGRTSNKLRSYIRAAYQVAKASRSKATVPLKFKYYNVTSNPAADTAPDESANKADKRPLSVGEMRSYWKIIKGMDGFKGAVLRLHLLTGGQRIKQLVALKTRDVTADAIMLFDGKGRPGKPPRPHTIPLIQAAAQALAECKPEGEHAISTNGGKTPLGATTLSGWAAEAGEHIPDFQAKRLRSGVETLLASAGISKEIRGRLQSHGISGVQAAHYDAHDYVKEKRQALETLFRLLTAPKATNVVPLKTG
jgi:integrase